MRLLGALLFVLSVSVFSQGMAQYNYRTYHNARFDYSISYPANVLTPQGESENGDGQKFLSKDGRAEMLVYGSNNSLDQTLLQVYESETSRTEHPNRRVTYRVRRGDWFVVSGIEGGKIFYQKTFLRKGVFKTFRLEYEEGAKQTFDPITSRIAGSFKG